MANKILMAIHYCFYIYMFLIFVRCFLTWIPNLNWDNPILAAIRSAADIWLNLFRKIIPPVGMFDISPVVAMIVLIPLEYACLYAAGFLLAILGVG